MNNSYISSERGDMLEALLASLLSEALLNQASDLHFISSLEAIVFMRKRGKITKLRQLSVETYQRMIQYLKFLSDIDLNRPRDLQTGHFSFLLQNKEYHLRLSFVPGLKDEHLDLRILNNHPILTLEDITCNELDRLLFQKIIEAKGGLVVFCGATGSGKSTTLHTLLNIIDQSRTRNIITVEDPIEIENKHFIQIQVDEAAGLNFADALKQVLRHDPDVVMIGEIRDALSAELALRSALSGHLTLTTLHAGNVKAGIRRLLNLGILEDDLKEALKAIIAQKLIYSENQLNPFCIHEFLAYDQLKKYFNNEVFEYLSFDYVFDDLKRQGKLTEKDVIGEYEYE